MASLSEDLQANGPSCRILVVAIHLECVLALPPCPSTPATHRRRAALVIHSADDSRLIFYFRITVRRREHVWSCPSPPSMASSGRELAAKSGSSAQSQFLVDKRFSFNNILPVFGAFTTEGSVASNLQFARYTGCNIEVTFGIEGLIKQRPLYSCATLHCDLTPP
jgi:hypothetical protein